jgi:glycosyltransferase involved in cell wall biosynthesis
MSRKMSKKIYFDHHFGMHSSFREITDYPPKGYEYVLPNSTWDKVFDRTVRRNEFIYSNFLFIKIIGKLVAPRLFKARLDRLFKKPPEETDLIFAMDHTIMWQKPWIILIGWPQMLTGQDPRKLAKYRKGIEKQFTSIYCRKVIAWCELDKKAIELNFDCSRFRDKIEVVPLAIHPQEFIKIYNKDIVRLLFVGTVNPTRGIISKKMGTLQFFEFDGKGGREIMEAFNILRQKYSNIELVIRASIPTEMKKKYADYQNIKFIEEILPREQLDQEFMKADIFVYPTKQMTPWGAFLEAMSFELPIVTTDVYANNELVQDGITGLLVKGPKVFPYYWKNLLPAFGSPLHQDYMQGMTAIDSTVISDLVDKISCLIENTEFRRKLGKAGRQAVEKGKHSIESRNKQLQRIFDESINQMDQAIR